jgi:two-component system, NarL family, sensor histidine kinase DegS
VSKPSPILSSLKISGRIAANPHLWIILTISIILVFIYQAWPWREWQFATGIWQWVPWLANLHSLAIIEWTGHIVGLLFFIPIIYASVVFSWPGTLAITLIAFARILPIIVGIWTETSIITNIVVLIIPFLFLSLATIELEKRRRDKEYAARREQERKIYLSKILEAQEKERQRIAQDLHDDTIQTLLFTAHSMETLASEMNDNRIASKTLLVKDSVLKMIEDLRGICLDLRPSILDELGLVPALRWLVDCMNTDSSIHTQIKITGEEKRLSLWTELALYRVVQEALNNIKKHSSAKNAYVRLDFDAEQLKLTITDDGKGFHVLKRLDDLPIHGKLGLIGIRQRIALLDGHFEVHSQPGNGTELKVAVQY